MNKEGKNKPNIVIPTIRGLFQLKQFFCDWREDFNGCHIILIEDKEKKTLQECLKVNSDEGNFTYEHYDWRDIEKDMGEDAWIFSRHSDAIRSYGFYKAWQNEAAFIVTLDDDVAPLDPGHHIQEFGKLLLVPQEHTKPNFFSTLKSVNPRGTFSEKKSVKLAHGMWLTNPDLSGLDQLNNHKEYGKVEYGQEEFNEGIVPKDCLFSICSMNVAFATNYTPYSYFGLQGSYKPKGKKTLQELPMDRCGDIWTGYRMKRFADEQGDLCHTGKPYVVHNRASNVWGNISREKEGWESTERLAIDKDLNSSKLPKWYLEELNKAELIWRKLFLK